MPTSSSDRAPNPYQPPSTIISEPDLTAPTEVTFQLNSRLRRYATDQYLLHFYPRRLLISSLIMILISGVCLVASLRVSSTAVLPTMVVVMLVSAAIYTALVHRTKKLIRRRLQEFGLASDQPMTIHSDADQLRLANDGGTHAWPNDSLKIYRAKRGLLICPEPLLFIFIPKQSDFQTESYQQFLKVIKSRTAPI